MLDRVDGNLNNEAVTVAEKILTPDPFKDVIRTEPAPNLQSLMSDMAPFLARKTTPLSQGTEKRQLTTSAPAVTTTTSTTTSTTKNTETQSEDEGFSLDKVFQFFFSNENKENQEISTNKNKIANDTFDSAIAEAVSAEIFHVSPSTPQTPNLPQSTSTIGSTTQEDRTVNEVSPSSTGSSTGMALLINLAGCNIYGRMYRVGRIISELSGPCLECKCTEIGVQCQPLRC